MHWWFFCGLWIVVYGLWFVVYGLWFVVYGLWFQVRDSEGARVLRDTLAKAGKGDDDIKRNVGLLRFMTCDV